jgi:hypothetical protein
VWAVVVSEVNIVRLEYRIFVGRKNLLPVLIIFFEKRRKVVHQVVVFFSLKIRDYIERTNSTKSRDLDDDFETVREQSDG